jgi:hypothetical protein
MTMIRFHTRCNLMICPRFRAAGSSVIKIFSLNYLPERPVTGWSHSDPTFLPKKFSPSEYPSHKTLFIGIKGQRDRRKCCRKSAGRIEISSVVQPERFNHEVSSAFSPSFIFSSSSYKGTANISRKFVRPPTFVHIPVLNDSCHTAAYFDENHSGKCRIGIDNMGDIQDASGLSMKHLLKKMQYFRWLSPAMKVLQFSKTTYNSFHCPIPQNYLSIRFTSD